MDETQRNDGLLMEDAPIVDTAPVSPDEFVAWVTGATNIAVDLTDEERNKIARRAVDDWRMDRDSMSDWLAKSEKAISLASLVKEKKDYPFENAANVKYPLITSAALQFNARAYPAIVPDDRVVKAKVWGRDPQGTKAARGERVSEFMSYQLSNKIEEWESETDKLLVVLPIVGDVYRKWWYDDVDQRPRCRLIEPGKLIVNSKAKSLSDAPRMTEEIALYPGEIESRIRAGTYIQFEFTPEGMDHQAAQELIEQHMRFDLDGDGYDEPYIATVHVDSVALVRLVADFGAEDVRFVTDELPVEVMAPVTDQLTGITVQVPQVVVQPVKTGIMHIRRGSYFAAYKLIPGMDGGFHGTGLGVLLGDISETINSIFNTLLDAGHYASLGGGFIGAELRMKGGAQRFRPGEWKLANGYGDDIRSAIVPITFPGPDATLFQMLGMLIEAGREIASVKDVITGDAPRQQTATTTLAMIEQGMMVFTAAYKRIFRALKTEYKLLARINAATLSREEYNAFLDDQQDHDPAQDFGASDMDVEPVADPRTVTKMQSMAKGQLVMQLADQGLVDKGEALKRVAEAASIADVEALMPKPDPMQQQMMQMQAAVAETQLMQARADVELTLAKIEGERAGAMKDMAAAQAQVFGARMDDMRMMLEDRRARLDQLLKGLGGVAGKPGNDGVAGGNGQGFGPPQAGAGVVLPFGPGGIGGGSSGAAFG